MIQKEKILESLRRQGSTGACTEELTNQWHIRRVAARVKDLRIDGKVIATQRCKIHGDARYVLVTWRREQPPIPEPDYDAIYADMKERGKDPAEPPEPEPPVDDTEDTFHTSAIWGDSLDGADFLHDSAVDEALGEGISHA